MANKKQSISESGSGEQTPIGQSGNEQTTQQSNPAGGINASAQPKTGNPSSAPSTGGQSVTGQPSSAGPGTGQSTTGIATTTSAGGAGAGTAVAKSLYDQAKETAGQAYEIAAEKATTKLEEQKTTLSGGLSTIAESVRKVGENLRGPDVQEGIGKYTAEYSGKAAEKIEGVADYFERKGVREMYSDLENFARRNPLAFIGGAFAIGLLTARFLKSDSPDRMASSGAAFASESEPRPASQIGSSYR